MNSLAADIGSRQEIRPLTSIRYFAALLVFAEHLQMRPGLEWMGISRVLLGTIGVTTFFVLSGYIIAYSYFDFPWETSFCAGAKRFYWSRFARIYPLHWLTFLFALPLGLNSNTARVSVEDFPLLLTLTDRLWPGFPLMVQPVKAAWTLSCEVLFYLLAPLVLWFVRRTRKPLSSSVALLIVYTTTILFVASRTPHLNWSAYLYVPDFLLGISGFVICRRFPPIRIARSLIAAGLCVCGIMLVVEVQTYWLHSHYVHAPGALMIICGCAFARGNVEKWLSLPLLLLLGQASYAFYLLHDPVLRYCRVAMTTFAVRIPAEWSVPFGVVLIGTVTIASIISFKFFEDPVRLRLRSWRKGASATQAKSS